MKIPFILNGTKTVIEASPSDKLSSVLRNMNLISVKCGCLKGICGNCMILLDDEPVPSCTIPAGIIRDRKIETLEHFKTSVFFQDILTGFKMAGIHLCGYCDAGKIFTAYKLIKDFYRPEQTAVFKAIEGLNLCCTDRDTLANGIYYAVSAKHSREGKHNAKK